MPRKTNFEVNGSTYYRATATVGKDSTTGKPLRKQFYGSSKKEAEAKRDAYINNIKSGMAYNYDKATFGVAFESWFFTVLKPSVSLSSYRRYEIDYRLRIRDCGFAAMRLVDIRAANIQAYYNELIEKCTINTLRCTDKLIRQFFAYCVKSDLLIKSPIAAVEMPADKSVKKEKHIPTREEVQHLIDEARNNPDAIIFAFSALSGLREGETLALEHADIDMIAGAITVKKTVDFLTVDGVYTPVVSSPKTKNSNRTVPIMGALKPLLAAHIRREKEKHLKAGVKFAENSILFSSATCNYLDGSNLRKRFKRLLNKLNIEETTIHALRHSFCTLLAEQGVPLKTASMILGHSDISITARFYTHVDESEKKRGIEKLAEIFV
jgi:integrase